MKGRGKSSAINAYGHVVPTLAVVTALLGCPTESPTEKKPPVTQTTQNAPATVPEEAFVPSREAIAAAEAEKQKLEEKIRAHHKEKIASEKGPKAIPAPETAPDKSRAAKRRKLHKMSPKDKMKLVAMCPKAKSCKNDAEAAYVSWVKTQSPKALARLDQCAIKCI
jgi:hypothetical protein